MQPERKERETELTEQERQDLVAYLDGELGELNPDAARALEAKLAQNATARREAEALQRTWEMLDYLPRPKAPASFTHQTVQKLTVGRPSLVMRLGKQRLQRAAWAAGAAAAGILGFLIAFHWPHPELPTPSADDIRVLRYLPFYEKVESVEFLQELNHPELFGDES